VLQLRPEIFDLGSLAREVMENSSLSHPDYTHLLLANEPTWIEADRDRMAQVVTNLVDNAIKYNLPGGMVEVSVRPLHGERIAEIKVSDNGAGFLPEQSEEVFERFARLGTVANHSRGMGLGLFICRQIVEAHGGTITAYSGGPGQGATFTAHLPLVMGNS
jgi:signal transduction histidine kinase